MVGPWPPCHNRSSLIASGKMPQAREHLPCHNWPEKERNTTANNLIKLVVPPEVRRTYQDLTGGLGYGTPPSYEGPRHTVCTREKLSRVSEIATCGLLGLSDTEEPEGEDYAHEADELSGGWREAPPPIVCGDVHSGNAERPAQFDQVIRLACDLARTNARLDDLAKEVSDTDSKRVLSLKQLAARVGALESTHNVWTREMNSRFDNVYLRLRKIEDQVADLRVSTSRMEAQAQETDQYNEEIEWFNEDLDNADKEQAQQIADISDRIDKVVVGLSDSIRLVQKQVQVLDRKVEG